MCRGLWLSFPLHRRADATHDASHGPGALLRRATVSARRVLFRYFTNALTPAEALALLRARAAGSAHYPGVKRDLLRECRLLVLAMVTTWRWDRDDQFPDGRQ